MCSDLWRFGKSRHKLQLAIKNKFRYGVVLNRKLHSVLLYHNEPEVQKSGIPTFSCFFQTSAENNRFVLYDTKLFGKTKWIFRCSLWQQFSDFVSNINENLTMRDQMLK